MAFHVRDEETDRLVRELAKKRGLGITETVRTAVESELKRMEDEPSLWERTADLRAEVRSWGDSGLKADKAFYDWLSGEEDDEDVDAEGNLRVR